MCTAPAADDEKKYLLRLFCGNGLAIDAYHAMPLRAFAFYGIRATVYGATPAAIENHTVVLSPPKCFSHGFFGRNADFVSSGNSCRYSASRCLLSSAASLVPQTEIENGIALPF